MTCAVAHFPTTAVLIFAAMEDFITNSTDTSSVAMVSHMTTVTTCAEEERYCVVEEAQDHKEGGNGGRHLKFGWGM